VNQPSVLYRALAYVTLILGAIVFLVPTFVQPTPKWWPWQQPIRLGLDLQGGTHLVYHVDIDKAVDNLVERAAQDLEGQLRQAQIGATTIDRDGKVIRVKLANPDKRDAVRDLVKDQFPNLTGANVPPEVADLAFTLDQKEELRIRDNAVNQALQIIRNRIDEFGVSEPIVQAQGSDEIVVQLPGIQDPQRAKDLIGRTAVLEFKLLAQGPNVGTVEKPGPGIQTLNGKGEGGRRQQYLVEKRVLMTGDVVKDASIRPSGQNEGMEVDFKLDSRGAKQFGQLTTQNVGRQLAIVLDGSVESAPQIREPITGGQGVITGRFAFAEAQDLANVLRNGALPAPLSLEEERTVGPSLGNDSIRKGVLSFAVGTAAVVIFMLVYYKGGGLIADLALIVNVLLLIGAFAAFGFTLTLPGIAGIVLTLGMAVDANVLILERIREELRNGKTVRAAVEAGYDRAWYAIRDSNITTLASGLILFNFGTGPVRGFAVTLCVGILTSVLTGVFATRVVYDWRLSGQRLTSISV
jgi:preprotein translocase subunit SecD